MIGGISFSATSITSGLDADKPASPKPGSQYLATDTKILYVCYEVGTWVNASPPLPKIAIVETASNPDGTGTEIFYKELQNTDLPFGAFDCTAAPSYHFTVQTDFTAYLTFFTRGYEGTGSTIVRMCINGSSAFYQATSKKDGVTDILVRNFKKGDYVKVVARRDADHSHFLSSLSIKCKPILNIDGVKFTPTSIDQSAFLLMHD